MKQETRKRCGANGHQIKDERPTTWSRSAAPRAPGIPPPGRMALPKHASDERQYPRRRESIPIMNNSSVFHPVLPLRGGNEHPPTALIPYQPVAGNETAPFLRRPRGLTQEENSRIMKTANETWENAPNV